MSAKPALPRVQCPTCGEPVVWSETAVWRPFCSERCRLLDLGAWFDETRSIPGAEPQSDADVGTDVSPFDPTEGRGGHA